MSREIYQIYKIMNRNDLNTQLALQCAPLLAGIKISNLLIIQRFNKENVMKLFQKTDISYYILYESDDKVTFLLFNKQELSNYLTQNSVSDLLYIWGYYSLELDVILEEFSKRYSKYMKHKSDFPHEMGLLLGYPVEDVTGFIENQGRNYLYIGYWKVYSNLSEAIHLFNKYNEAKEEVIVLLSKGNTIHNIIRFFVEIEASKNINIKG